MQFSPWAELLLCFDIRKQQQPRAQGWLEQPREHLSKSSRHPALPQAALGCQAVIRKRGRFHRPGKLVMSGTVRVCVMAWVEGDGELTLSLKSAWQGGLWKLGSVSDQILLLCKRKANGRWSQHSWAEYPPELPAARVWQHWSHLISGNWDIKLMYLFAVETSLY